MTFGLIDFYSRAASNQERPMMRAYGTYMYNFFHFSSEVVLSNHQSDLNLIASWRGCTVWSFFYLHFLPLFLQIDFWYGVDELKCPSILIACGNLKDFAINMGTEKESWYSVINQFQSFLSIYTWPITNQKFPLLPTCIKKKKLYRPLCKIGFYYSIW